MTDIAERLREQAWRRSGAPKMDAGHTKLLEWEAADEIERLRERVAALQAELGYTESIKANREGQTGMVYCVLCIDDRDRREDRVHIFTNLNKAEAWASTDPRRHVFYDYLLDHPERMERAFS